MLNKIKEGLQKYDCIILEHKDGVGIHSSIKGYPNPENYILVQEDNGCFKVFEVSRNDKFLRVESADEDYIFCCAMMLFKSHYMFSPPKSYIYDYFEKCVEQRKFDNAYEFIAEKTDKKYFVVNQEELTKVSMIIDEDIASIKYQNIYIIKDKPLRIAYVVLYNYTKKLMEFDMEFKALSLKYDIKDKYDELARLYLFGRIVGPY